MKLMNLRKIINWNYLLIKKRKNKNKKNENELYSINNK